MMNLDGYWLCFALRPDSSWLRSFAEHFFRVAKKMEVAGFEPASSRLLPRASTCLADHLAFLLHLRSAGYGKEQFYCFKSEPLKTAETYSEPQK